MISYLAKRWYLFILLSTQFLFCANDFESRNTISYGFKLPYSIKLDCEQSLRLTGQELAFKQTFTELSLSKQIINDLKLFIPIRYAIFDDKVKNRISLGGIYKITMKPMKFKYKTRFQRTHEKSKSPDDLFRNKLYAHFKLSKKFEPFLSCEIFHPANSNNNELNEYRFSLGTNLDFPRKKSLKLFYQYKIEDLDKKNPDEHHIIGLSLGLN